MRGVERVDHLLEFHKAVGVPIEAQLGADHLEGALLVGLSKDAELRRAHEQLQLVQAEARDASAAEQQELANELEAKGLSLKVVISDSGGEFAGDDAEAMYRRKGIVHRVRVRETHDDKAELAVKRVKDGIRAAMHLSKAPPSYWIDAACCVAAGLQAVVDAATGTSAHAALFHHEPDLTALLPFYSIVNALSLIHI